MTKYYVRASHMSEIWHANSTLTVLHRVFGPACEWVHGAVWWCQDGELHRENGPAAVEPNGIKSYYLNGKRYEKLEYEQILHVNRNKR